MEMSRRQVIAAAAGAAAGPNTVTGRDPRRFLVPVTASLPPGATARIDLPTSRVPMRVSFTANGARTRTTLIAVTVAR